MSVFDFDVVTGPAHPPARTPRDADRTDTSSAPAAQQAGEEPTEASQDPTTAP
jgi:hypothetical protein